MTPPWTSAFEYAVKGDFTHIDPVKLLEGVDAEAAGRTIPGLPNTIFQIASHLISWWEWCHAVLKAEEYNASDAEYQANFFPTSPGPSDAAEWDRIKGRIAELQKEYIALLERVDPAALHPEASMHAWLSTFTHARALILVVQHTAYHMAQIVTMRRLLGIFEK